MPNPEAMLLIAQGGSPETIDLEADAASTCRYEALFGMRNELVNGNVNDGDVEANEARMSAILDHLLINFGSLPDAEDTDQAVEIVTRLIANPTEIENLTERQLSVIEDVVVNVGLIRTLLYSYQIALSDDFINREITLWMMRYRRYMAA